MYHVKEIFYSIQGEGMHAGRPAVFCRFSGCNLWSGREADREKAICSFCDTEFVGTDGLNGGIYSAAELATKITQLWPSGKTSPFVVLTGGEPMLQVDAPLLSALKGTGAYVAIETNGTKKVPLELFDWVTVSPKAGAAWVQKQGDELKLVYPQKDMDPGDYLREGRFDHYLLQPMDGARRIENTQATVRFCLGDPHWKVSLQLHKILNLR